MYPTALKLFENTLSAEKRVVTEINLGLLKLVDEELIQEASSWVVEALSREKRVWLTSDLHFGHKNIITYSDRPFGSVGQMTQAHLALLRKIPADELLIIAGDAALGNLDEAVDLLRAISCPKILVAGNHDMTRDGKFRYKRAPDLFDAVVPFLHWQGGLGRLVMVTHYPLAVTMHDVATSVINYHGHLHQLHMNDSTLVKYINVGWDAAHGLICL